MQFYATEYRDHYLEYIIDCSVIGVKKRTYFLQTIIMVLWLPVHSFTSSNHCLAGLPHGLSPSTLLCKVVFAVPFALTTWEQNKLIVVGPMYTWFLLEVIISQYYTVTMN